MIPAGCDSGTGSTHSITACAFADQQTNINALSPHTLFAVCALNWFGCVPWRQSRSALDGLTTVVMCDRSGDASAGLCVDRHDACRH